ncbi:hypothetical protein BJF78_07055 [Pseudonocardia sp. CNS-139]|nr:hypothetical protein BJF78_07055 [Pseudonocardia sp. CNS-139]
MTASGRPRTRGALRLAATGIATAVIAAAAPAFEAAASVAGAPTTIEATELVQVAPVDPPRPTGDFGTVLEGGAFGPDGDLYFVRATAEAGRPKVVALDLDTLDVRTVFTDSTSTFSSTQFSPTNGLLYVTDFAGTVIRMKPDGTDVTTIVSGDVLGAPVVYDDLAFDEAGNFYVTDMRGTPWAPTGRVLRFGPDGQDPVLLMDGLAAPNGIAFDPAHEGLWISEHTGGRVDHLHMTADGRVSSAHIGMQIDTGDARLDSTAVDSEGNIYVAVWGGGKVLVLRPDGTLAARIVIPDAAERGLDLTTNLAIKPGTTDGYLVTGGRGGGYVYTFTSLAPGGGQSNGGGA